MSESNIKRYTHAELKVMRGRGESRSDFAAVERMTEEELEASIASDADWKDIPADWYLDAVMVTPAPKKLLSLRLDNEIVDWFKQQGPGYQTKINAVLRKYVDYQVAGKTRV